MFWLFGDQEEGDDAKDAQGQHAASGIGNHGDVGHHSGGGKGTPSTPPNLLAETQKKRQAGTGDHGDCNAIVVHAAEALLSDPVASSQVRHVGFESDIGLGEHQYPSDLLKTLDRIDQCHADNERQHDFGL